MSDSCCSAPPPARADGRYRRVLWIALAVNLAMFLVEIVASVGADSVSLLADAVDFGGDAANYGLSLGALAMGAAWRSRAALAKGATMTAYGLFVIGRAGWALAAGSAPQPLEMGVVGLLALAANLAVAVLLYTYRHGDADMRSVWLCTRNDALGNVAVLLAAAGVAGSGSHAPDLLVAAVMATLALSAGVSTVRRARGELAAAGRGPVVTTGCADGHDHAARVGHAPHAR